MNTDPTRRPDKQVRFGDSTPILTGVMFGLALAWALPTIPNASCVNPDRLEAYDPRMVIVMPYERETHIRISRDRYTGRLCYSTDNGGIWCESVPSTAPDDLLVRP